MDEENQISSKNDRKPWATIIRVGFELFIVFVGVWGALLAESWRERREENRAAAAVLEAAVANLRGTADWSTAWRDSLLTEYEDWEARRAQGEVIPPFFMRIPGSESPDAGIVGAAAFLPDALGPEVVRRMGERANEMEGLGRRISRYMELTERTVFPGLDSDPSGFYDPVSGDLLPEYQGQLRLMKELWGEMDRLTTEGRQLADFLEEELRRRH